jgi:hypothetical protein
MNFLVFWQQILTDAALLKRQKKEIEELRAKLMVLPPPSVSLPPSLFIQLCTRTTTLPKETLFAIN